MVALSRTVAHSSGPPLPPRANRIVNNLPLELTEVVVGSLLAAIGLAALLVGASARPRRHAAALWFGVFALLYGVRLGAKSDLVHAALAWPTAIFGYVDALITYAILVPAGLFIESLVGPGWHGLIRRTWQVTCVYAAAATINDLVQRPYASMWVNPLVVLPTVLLLVPHVVARARTARWTVEGWAVVVTGALFAGVAILETVRARGLFGQGFDGEPVAMLAVAAALGWFVLARAREQADGFAALSRELQLARTIQQSLLPTQLPIVAGLRVHGTYLPMSAVAGDFYDVVALPGGRLMVIVADVSGHGVPAALVASMVKVAFAAELERSERPGELLGGINRTLAGKFEHAYVTACCALLDPAHRRLEYAAAGHPPALLRRLDGGVERLEEGGIVLTLLPVATYTTAGLPFDVGDCLLLFTDGLLEAARPEDADAFFGDTELTRVVAALPPASDVSQSVLRAHRAWIGDQTPLSDDVTLVIVEAII